MSQQFRQQSTQPTQYGQQFEQPGSQQQQMQPVGSQGVSSQQPPKFEDHLTNELRIALEDLNDVTHVAEWCAVTCARAGPQLADCVRVCEDLAELAELNEKLIARDSMFGPEVAEAFVRVAQEALPEIQQHQQNHPHVTEVISATNRAIDSCTTLLEMSTQQKFGSQTGQQIGGTQTGQQVGGQQTGQQIGTQSGQQMRGQQTRSYGQRSNRGYQQQ